MAESPSFKVQFKSNLVAIISVVIAILALSYNSWRNELSEDNRNVRAAGFEIMREAAKLQFYIDTTTYTEASKDDDVIQGWVSINLMISLAELMSPTIRLQAHTLKQVWAENWSKLASDKKANQSITDATNQLVKAVRQHLKRLR